MEKLKKILTALSGAINSQELSTALSASDLSAHDWSDDGLNEIEAQVSALITPEAAKNSTEIREIFRKDPSFIEAIIKDNPPQVRQVKAGMLEGMAVDLRSHLRSLGIEVSDEAKYQDVFKLLTESDLSKADPNAKANIEKLSESRDLLAKELKEKEEAWATEKQAIEQEFERKQTRATILRKLSNKPWLEAYDDFTRDAIIDRKLAEVEGSAIMKLEGDEVVFYDPAMPEQRLHLNNGKDLATFETVIEPAFDPYFKKSNSEDPKDPDPKKKVVLEDPSYADMTERERYIFNIRKTAEA